jgi:hypothetical protein
MDWALILAAIIALVYIGAGWRGQSTRGVTGSMGTSA